MYTKSWECEEVAQYVDYLQIPAFLCRQTELLISAGKTGKPINIKKDNLCLQKVCNLPLIK